MLKAESLLACPRYVLILLAAAQEFMPPLLEPALLRKVVPSIRDLASCLLRRTLRACVRYIMPGEVVRCWAGVGRVSFDQPGNRHF
jgi:hypothetical protein